MNIGSRIQFLRKTKGISQEEFADEIGVSRQAVSKWESEQSLPELEKIVLMTDYFDVTSDYLLKGLEHTAVKEEGSFELLLSEILYIASTAFIALGMLWAFVGWHENKTLFSTGIGLSIQLIGITGYFIASRISSAKAEFMISWLNLIGIIFIPFSMLTAAISNAFLSPYPYPEDIIHFFLFICVYSAASIISFKVLRNKG